MTQGVGGQSPGNITHHLKGMDFPADRSDLERQAQENGAGEDVMDIIRQLPDQQYESMADVTKGVGEVE
ncbi:DUF2795 domain-containing protein [Chromohalobacter canadensis]|uniref:DUF2795 domain-containing protein n=1 Tax=Chromohalobacter canadensis TaxID=141389 RepID=UPI00240F9266|nr:DUF2795 domain-containing protein [Chromohalobacter canadensis]